MHILNASNVNFVPNLVGIAHQIVNVLSDRHQSRCVCIYVFRLRMHKTAKIIDL